MMRTIRIATLLVAMFALMAPATALAGHHEKGEAMAENPCADNPCAEAKADNPCADNPCAEAKADNPCADNPCAAVKAPARKKAKSN